MVELPNDSGTPLNRGEKMHANKKEPGSCPQCGSRLHFEVSRILWCCSECDTDYKAPIRKVYNAETDSVEMVAA
jgi:ribosomal protein L37AE/L43A